MTIRPHRFQKTLAKFGPSKPAPPSAAPACSLSIADLSHFADGWLIDCEIRQHSRSTLTTRRMTLNNLLWFLRRTEKDCCSVAEMREFFTYLLHGHKEDGGRWGNPQMNRPVRPRTVDTYHGHLRTFFTWVIAQGALSVSPMSLISAPICRADQIQPFTTDQIEAVLAAARTTQNPRRDEAIILMLLDTGIRASELCGLKQKDLDLTEKRITVLGKGNKKRTIYFGQRVTKALWTYLRDKEVQPELPLFPSESTGGKGDHLSRYGLRDMIERLAALSKVKGVRCSAHTFRHSFAVSFLRAGGQVFALKEILGHTDLKMTAKYVSLAEADLASQRRYSPADQLTGRGASGQSRVWNRQQGNGNQGKSTQRSSQKSSQKSSQEVSRDQPGGFVPQPKKITQSKLTESQVREIKAKLAAPDGRTKVERRAEIAQCYGISSAAVKEIDLGYSWRHIE